MYAQIAKLLLPIAVKVISQYIDRYEKGTAIEDNWKVIVSKWQKKHSMPDDMTAAHKAAQDDIEAWEKKRLEEIKNGQTYPL